VSQFLLFTRLQSIVYMIRSKMFAWFTLQCYSMAHDERFWTLSGNR
jgi:hypothetical protein